ncbi:MAG: dihydrolipoamide acetyltransferase family protein [Acidimicrobiales bacterium]
MADIKMPQLGETVTEGTVTKWLKKVGDTVALDEILFEVSTDKVDSEVPSSAAGVISAILVQEGETVDVGTVLATVGDGASAPEPVVAAPAPAPAPEPVAAAPAPAPAPEPVAAAPAPAILTGSNYGASTPGDVSGNGHTDSGLLLSPVVRRLIKENDLDVAQIPGTGAGGRITRADVLSYLDRQGASGVATSVPATPAPAPAPPAAPATPVAQTAPAPAPQAALVTTPTTAVQSSSQAVAVGPRDEVIPFNNIRRRTAEHMVRSKATSAHTLVAIEVDFEPVERVRQQLRDQFKNEEGFSLTYLPFIARATVEAIRTYPKVNASVGEDALIVHKDIHLSIAVDLDLDGLIAPVIHDADTKRLTGIAREIRDLASRARARKLNADDIAGGTFTITNPGPFGTFITAPIINQPQIAILSTDGVKRKPVVVTHPDGSESIAIHSVGILALSFDHRVVDGAYASAFLARIKEVIEAWNWAQEF